MTLDLRRHLARLGDDPAARVRGRVRGLAGLVLRASIPGAALGHLVHLEVAPARAVRAQVIGFREDEVLLMALDRLDGVGPDTAAVTTGAPPALWCGDALLGRVLDGLGEPIDGGPALDDAALRPQPIDRAPPPPMSRPPIRAPLWTGVRVIDGLLTLGRGQRVGLFAGSGVGKSLLLGQLARGAEADVVVICLVGERGRELVSFIQGALGAEGLRRAVVVCATSDAPALARRQAPLVATAIAEHFRDQGREVLLLMDSVTRFARAQREVGLACGEPPVRRGYPPSVFSALPQLLERAGTSPTGCITAIYTALVENDDMDDPVADELRGLLDGHILLSRALAQRASWPAVDPTASLSRLMSDLVSDQHRRAADEARRALALAASKRDLIAMGAWRRGADPALDDALAISKDLEPWLQQRLDERSGWEDTLEGLLDVVG